MTVLAVETCPLCGGPRSDFSCRRVPMGDWCQQYGLKEDPRRIIGPSPDPLAEAVAKDRRVRAAEAAYQKAVARENQARAEFEQAAAAHRSAQFRTTRGQDVVTADGRLQRFTPKGAGRVDIARLEQEAEATEETWRASAEAAIRARQELEQAKARARAELATAERT